MKVLIAEDEVTTAKALMTLLHKNKFSVDLAYDGLDAMDLIDREQYEVIVLDIMMPGMDGISVLKEMRKKKNTTPVMLLTARSDISDRVLGLEAGADDYLPKPFAFMEFLARVKALARRSGEYADEKLRIGNLLLDCNRYMLSSGDRQTSLNNKEFQLIDLFMRHPGFVFSTERLMNTVWGNECDSNIDVVWTHIGFLRKKMKKLGTDVEIKTIRGAGYMLKEAL